MAMFVPSEWDLRLIYWNERKSWAASPHLSDDKMDYNIRHPAAVSRGNPDLLLGAAALQRARCGSRTQNPTLKMFDCDGVD